MKRQLRTRLSLVKPHLAETIEAKQEQCKKQHDRAPERRFSLGDHVRVRNIRGGHHDKWLHGTILEVLGTRTYKVDVCGRVKTVHIDHLIPAFDRMTGIGSKDHLEPLSAEPYTTLPPVQSPVPIESPPVPSSDNDHQPAPDPPAPKCDVPDSVQERRYPLRGRKPKEVIDV